MKSWNWLDNSISAILLVAVEAGCFTAWVGALAHTNHHHAVDLPYLFVLCAAVVAVVVTSRMRRLFVDSRVQSLAIALVSLIGAGCTAGALGALYFHASFLAVSSHPWTITAELPGDGAALAWFVGAVVWLRSATLGRSELAFSQALNSVVVVTVAYTVFFLVGAFEPHAHAYRAELGPAAIVLIVTFPLAMGVVALEHERDLERLAASTRTVRPQAAWVAAVVLPMIAVAVIALGFAFIVGPLAPIVRRVTVFIVRGIAVALIDLARAIGRLLPRAKGHRPIIVHGAASGGAYHQTGHLPSWLIIVVAVMGAMVVLVAVFFAVRFVLQLRLRLARHRTHDDSFVEEERESVFSAAHLLDQLRALWRRLISAIVSPHRAFPAALNQIEIQRMDVIRTIRQAYRQVLQAARSNGQGRRDVETPAEFETRVTSLFGGDGQAALIELTSLYERARYGDVLDSSADLARAIDDASIVANLFDEKREPI